MSKHREDCPGVGNGCTLHQGPDAATVCRRNGWEAGTVLVGDEGYGDLQILIVAVGEREILERPADGVREGMWTLTSRCWRPA